MANVRAQLFFVQGIQGWSETYFLSTSSLDLALSKLDNLANLRLALSPDTVVLTYQRVSVDGVFRDAQINVARLNGSFPDADGADPSFVSVLLRIGAQNRVRRPLFLRGVPDTLIINGVFNPSASWLNKFRAFKNALINDFAILAYDPTDAGLQVAGISVSGLVNVFGSSVYVAGDYVRFRNVKVSPKTSGVTWRVESSGPGVGQFTVANWSPRPLVTPLRGLVFSGLKTLINIDSVVLGRIVSRRVGRPFGLSRGRRKVTV